MVARMRATPAVTSSLAILVALANCQTPQPAVQPTGPTVKAGPTGPATRPVSTRPYLVRRAAGAISIDGKDHPQQWAHAQTIDDFRIPGSLQDARSRTSAQVCLLYTSDAADE